MSTLETIPAWAKPGVSFSNTISSTRSHLWHIRGIVDGCAVARRWRPLHQYWRYEVLEPTFFSVYGGAIKIIKRRGRK